MKRIFLLFSLILLPINIFAYSSEVYIGGQTIGIDAISDGAMVVGFYKINGKYNTTSPELLIGDYITKVNDDFVSEDNSLTSLIEKNSADSSVLLTVRRKDKEFLVNLNIVNDGNSFKTGIYIKDSITGIGTITFIDPSNMIFGALGHEILESTTSEIVDVSGGKIFENFITSIDKSKSGYPGSKNAKFYYDNVFGSIVDNTTKGIYGEYTFDVSDYELVEVATRDEVVIGPAVIYTVTDGVEVSAYDIYITNINEHSDVKNMTIEITDKKLIELSGGVVQGMSGSPIIQNGKIIGAVTHVIVDNPETGYGIFIENMLEVSDLVSE